MKIWQELYGSKCSEFWQEIIDGNYDYVVPVARKACKLMTASEMLWEALRERVFYRDYFEFANEAVEGKHIAIVDDSVQHGSGLREHRDYFEARKALVDTFAFVGHKSLLRRDTENHDEKMKVKTYLSEVEYRHYLMIQALYLIGKVAHQDMDHIVLQFSIENVQRDIVNELQQLLLQWGYSYDLYPLPGIQRFSLFQPTFYCLQNITESVPSVSSDFIEKLRFTFSEEQRVLTISPLVFPKVVNQGTCPWHSTPHYSFELPCEHFSSNQPHEISKICYLSSSIYLSVLLGKEFFRVLHTSSPDSYRLFSEQLDVRSGDLVRYFGKEFGSGLAKRIRDFLRSESVDEPASVLLRKKCPQRAVTPSILTNDFVPNLLNTLRGGYERLRVEKKTTLGIHFALTADELLELKPGTHPFALSEAMDDNCDFGYLVPTTEQRNGYWRRAFRTGEPTPAEMSVGLIAMAIQWMSLRKDGVLYKAHPESVGKALANLTFDFPSEHSDKHDRDYRYLHTLKSVPSYWGPEVFLVDPTTKVRIPLDEPERFMTPQALHHVIQDHNKRFFTTNEAALAEAVTKLKPIEQVEAFIDLYFKLMRELKARTRTDDSLNALALCRGRDWLFVHINFNVDNWFHYYGKFLGQYKTCVKRNVEYQEIPTSGPLHSAAREAHSASEKISYPEKLRVHWMPLLQSIVKENIELQAPLSKIEEEMIHIDPNDKEYKKYSSLVQSIATVSDVSLYLVGLKKKMDAKVYNLGEPALAQIGHTLDLDGLLASAAAKDNKTIIKELEKFYGHAQGIPSTLPIPVSPEEARSNTYYAKRDHSFMSMKIREGIDHNGWQEASFLAIDLSKSTSPDRTGDILHVVRGQFYDVVGKCLSKYGAAFKDPEGDDFYMALFGGDPDASLKAAREIQKYFGERSNYGPNDPRTIKAKFGLSILSGKDRMLDLQQQNTAMGIAKDCCVLKKGFHNVSDIVAPEDFVISTSSAFLSESRLEWSKLQKATVRRGTFSSALYRLRNKSK